MASAPELAFSRLPESVLGPALRHCFMLSYNVLSPVICAVSWSLTSQSWEECREFVLIFWQGVFMLGGVQ